MPISDGHGLPIAGIESGDEAAATVAGASRRPFSKKIAHSRLPDILCTAAAFAMVFAVVLGVGPVRKVADGGMGQRTALLQPVQGRP